MKNPWKRRGFALMTALALVIPTMGVAEDAIETTQYETAVWESEGDLPEEGAEWYGVPDADEAGEYADADDPDETDEYDADDPDEYDPAGGAALRVTPESTEETEAIPAPEATEDAEEAPVSDTAEDTEDTPVSDTAEDAEDAPDSDTAEDTEEPPVSDTAEDTEDAPVTDTAEDTEETPVSEATEDTEAVSVPEATQTPAETPAPKATEGPASAAALEGAETVPGETDGAAKAVAEAASATLAFPLAKLYIGKGEWRANPVQVNGGEGVTVTYSSNRKKIVTVDAAGTLHGVKKGTAKITATASNGEKVTCTVKVYKAPSRVRLNSKKLTMGMGEGRTLKAKLPRGTASAITWVSANPAVVTVDAGGNLLGVGVGNARVTARTYNGKRASCTVTVLGGRTPTSLSFPSKTISMGLKEKLQLMPRLGEGEAAIFSFSSSKKKVVSVTAGGLMTAKKKGTAKITVKTHNGLKYKLTVKVVKAPAKLTISKTSLTLLTGKTATLKATLPSGTASAITWSSSDPNVASVDGAGNIQALNGGTTQITASTFNGKSAACTLTVTVPTPETVPPALSNAQMAANLRADTSLGSKREALGNVAELLMNAGFEPSFAAGVCANVYSEGTYGLLESSKYVANYLKRPRYFCYLDGGLHYTLQNGEYVPDVEYVPADQVATYAGVAPKALPRYGEEKYYWNNWSGQYVWKVDLNALQAFIDALTAGGWEGKFGMGVTQWTGGRTRKLMKLYRNYAGEGNPTITKEQVIAAEHEMILYDLQGDYNFVYTTWKKGCDPALYSAEAARSAGSLLCLKYEIPANKETSAVKRGNNAAKFYQIMVGAN